MEEKKNIYKNGEMKEEKESKRKKWEVVEDKEKQKKSDNKNEARLVKMLITEKRRSGSRKLQEVDKRELMRGRKVTKNSRRNL